MKIKLISILSPDLLEKTEDYHFFNEKRTSSFFYAKAALATKENFLKKNCEFF
jgi:hypothetical protein